MDSMLEDIREPKTKVCPGIFNPVDIMLRPSRPACTDNVTWRNRLVKHFELKYSSMYRLRCILPH